MGLFSSSVSLLGHGGRFLLYFEEENMFLQDKRYPLTAGK